MKRTRHLHPRTRRRFSWLVALMLLWQQVAVAAYACATAPAAADAVAAVQAHSMAAMGQGCAQMPAAQVDPLCHQHCQPDHATQVDARTASVPVNALAALPSTLPFVAVAALPSNQALAWRDHGRASPPIPRLLFCSLLI